MKDHHPHSFREKVYILLFTNNTKAGYNFDIILTWMIVVSVATVILETVGNLSINYRRVFNFAEWVFTILFTIEYIFRLYSAKNRWKYAISFFGLVDLLAILPSYINIFFLGHQYSLVIRVLRLLRMFRIFKLGHFISEGAVVASALRASRIKILVFLSFVCISSVFMGSLMYFVEKDVNPGINNIPDGIYWAIVTITTVGYGDSIPITHLGKVLASIVMVLGYGVIAVPTGIVTAEITNRVLAPRGKDTMICDHCGNNDHLRHARYCHHCGEPLHEIKSREHGTKGEQHGHRGEVHGSEEDK